jgi:hypothetical protein
MERSDYYFIILIALGLSFIFLWQIGTFSSNLQTKNIANETKQDVEITKYETENQTKLIIDYFDRQNNTTHKILSELHEDDVKKLQMLGMLNQSEINQDIILGNMTDAMKQNHDILNFLNQSIKNQETMIAQNHNHTLELLQVSNEHKIVAQDHDMLQQISSNITNLTSNELNRYGENSILKLNEITDTQKEILKKLRVINNTITKIK